VIKAGLPAEIVKDMRGKKPLSGGTEFDLGWATWVQAILGAVVGRLQRGHAIRGDTSDCLQSDRHQTYDSSDDKVLVSSTRNVLRNPMGVIGMKQGREAAGGVNR